MIQGAYVSNVHTSQNLWFCFSNGRYSRRWPALNLILFTLTFRSTWTLFSYKYGHRWKIYIARSKSSQHIHLFDMSMTRKCLLCTKSRHLESRFPLTSRRASIACIFEHLLNRTLPWSEKCEDSRCPPTLRRAERVAQKIRPPFYKYVQETGKRFCCTRA